MSGQKKIREAFGNDAEFVQFVEYFDSCSDSDFYHECAKLAQQIAPEKFVSDDFIKEKEELL